MLRETICYMCRGDLPHKGQGQGRRVYCEDCAQDVIALHSSRKYRKADMRGREKLMMELRNSKHPFQPTGK